MIAAVGGRVSAIIILPDGVVEETMTAITKRDAKH